MNKMKVTTLCAALLVAGLAGCDGNDDDMAGSPDMVPPAATEPSTDMPPAGTDMSPAGGEGVLTVGMADEGGSYVADSAGNAVYMLEAEGDGVDACVGDCLETWPPVLVTDVQPSIDLGTDLDATLLGTVERDDGTMQVTYAGHPLYRYADRRRVRGRHGHDRRRLHGPRRGRRGRSRQFGGRRRHPRRGSGRHQRDRGRHGRRILNTRRASTRRDNTPGSTLEPGMTPSTKRTPP